MMNFEHVDRLANTVVSLAAFVAVYGCAGTGTSHTQPRIETLSIGSTKIQVLTGVDCTDPAALILRAYEQTFSRANEQNQGRAIIGNLRNLLQGYGWDESVKTEQQNIGLIVAAELNRHLRASGNRPAAFTEFGISPMDVSATLYSCMIDQSQ
ncbi:MAG: hypothetical protein AAGC56_12725, partial [Pseudomonadota bacterium]